MLFVVTVTAILMLALASFYAVWSASSKDGVTIKDLDNVYYHDQTYIAQAPRESWNDTD